MGPTPIVAPALSVDLVPAITTSAYAAGDALGSKITVVAKCPVKSNWNGPIVLVQSLSVLDLAAQKPEFDLHFFAADYTDPGDNNPFTLSAANARNWRGMIPVRSSNWFDLETGGSAKAVAIVRIAGVAFPVIGGQFFAQARVLGTPTFVSTSDLEFHLNGIFS